MSNTKKISINPPNKNNNIQIAITGGNKAKKSRSHVFINILTDDEAYSPRESSSRIIINKNVRRRKRSNKKDEEEEEENEDIGRRSFVKFDDEFEPQLYTFRVGTPAHDPSNYMAFTPPNWLLFDHTIAVIWNLFSKSKSKIKNIAQFQWALDFLRKCTTTSEPELDCLIKEIEDKLVAIYATQTLQNRLTSTPSKKSNRTRNQETLRAPQPPPLVIRKTINPQNLSETEERSSKSDSLENLLTNFTLNNTGNEGELVEKLDHLRIAHIERLEEEMKKVQNIEEVMSRVEGIGEFVRYADE